MTKGELTEKIKRLPNNTKLMFFPKGIATDEEGNLLPSGLGFMDIETKEFVYIGKITIIEVDDTDGE